VTQTFHTRLRPRYSGPAVDHDRYEPKNDAHREQDTGDVVLNNGSAGPGTREESAKHGPQDRQNRRRAEMLVIHTIAPKHQDRNVHHREDA
jgi:hypothetical protein